jgi:hypothetical protein
MDRAILQWIQILSSHLLGTRSEFVHSDGSHLSLCNMSLSKNRSRHQIDHVEQRSVLMFLFVKGLRYKVAHGELCSPTGEQAYSLSQMRRWIHRFKEGNLWWEDGHRPGRRLSELSGGIRGHLDKCPFTSVQQLAKHFSPFVSTISRILTAHLGLRQFSRRSAPHDLTDDQKQLRREISERLLNVLRSDESAESSQVTRGYES